MAGIKGYRNIEGMRGRRKGGANEVMPDGLDRSTPGTLASLLNT